jgi:hypothetical protein
LPTSRSILRDDGDQHGTLSRVVLDEDFDMRIGTYVKVVSFRQSANPDGFRVLYLRPSGRFLFAGTGRR